VILGTTDAKSFFRRAFLKDFSGDYLGTTTPKNGIIQQKLTDSQHAKNG